MAVKLFVTGIGTDIGKTIAAAILTQALEADYWKPVQSGNLDSSDTLTVKKLVSSPKTVFHPESYALTNPLSPHAAAALENISIHLNNIQPPVTQNHLIIEGAGGLMVPLNDQHLVIDLIAQLQIPAVLVSKNYLGSINHTLLSIEALKRRSIKIAGIIFNDEPNQATEEYILNYTNCPRLLSILPEPNITPEIINQYAQAIKPTIFHDLSGT